MKTTLKTKSNWIWVIFFLFLTAGKLPSAGAALVVDTGIPAAPPVGFAWALDNNQWFASQFNLAQSYTITALEGWIWEGESGLDRLTDGLLDVVLYGDSSNLPNTSNEIFRQTVVIPNNDPDGFPVDTPGVNPYNWHGATGMNLPLLAGTYWIAFESSASLYPNDYYDGAIGAPAPNPLSVEAYALGFDGIYKSLDSDIGVRVQGEPGGTQSGGGSQIPEPATLLMVGLGMMGTGFLRRFKK